MLAQLVAAIWTRLYPKVEDVVEVALEPEPETAPTPAQLPKPGRMLEAILAAGARSHEIDTGERLDWEHSIVDLMKLAGVDPSLAHRARLAHEFGHGGAFAGSEADNIWLRDRFLAWLRERGG
jgi:hypothetical protein